jgi:hypothetical protein
MILRNARRGIIHAPDEKTGPGRNMLDCENERMITTDNDVRNLAGNAIFRP